jgi:hypothetical protein
MDAIARYLHTLSWLLPKATRHDIVRELEEELRARADDQAQRLGRPLDDGEQEGLVRACGHPLLLAARYRPDRYLIGPVVFPYYWLVVKVIVGLTIAGHAIGMLIRGTGSIGDLGGPFERLVSAVLSEVGWMTLVAAAADIMTPLADSRVVVRRATQSQSTCGRRHQTRAHSRARSTPVRRSKVRPPEPKNMESVGVMRRLHGFGRGRLNCGRPQ